MSRPNILNKPRNINVIVESDEYEQILKKCDPNGFSAYLRELMRNDHLAKTTALIDELREDKSKMELKIRSLEDAILKMSLELKKMPGQEVVKAITSQALGIEIYCPACGIKNIKMKGGLGRKCFACGTWIA